MRLGPRRQGATVTSRRRSASEGYAVSADTLLMLPDVASCIESMIVG
jgi:hypothetical protein